VFGIAYRVQWNLDLRKPDLRKNLDLRKIFHKKWKKGGTFGNFRALFKVSSNFPKTYFHILLIKG
jgi:hypothetical protein